MNTSNTTWLNGAEKIGNQICREAVWYDSVCNWVSCRLESHNGASRVVYSMQNGSLYSGTSGIAFFLGALYSQTKDPLHKEVALGAIRNAFIQVPKAGKDRAGFYLGWPGIAFAGAAIAGWTEDEWVLSQSVDLMKALANNLPDTMQNDVVDGAAGALLCAIEFEKKSLGGPWQDLISRLANYLERTAEHSDSGISWQTMAEQSRNLCGYAHGVAGIATAFINLYEFTGDQKYLHMFQAAFQYENQFFDATEKNWPDFRASESLPTQPGSFACAWCHGAPGISLSRLRAFQVTGDLSYKSDALVAAETTLRHMTPNARSNFSLCHGLCGNADILLSSAHILNEPGHRDKAVETGQYALDTYLNENIPLPNGAFADWFNPDLMLGLSGIGYFLLRLYDPAQFESVLLLGQKRHTHVLQSHPFRT